MSDQNSEHIELLTAFYRDFILPFAKSAEDRGVDIFPMGFDPNCESYFADRSDGESYIHTIDYENLQGELQQLWAVDSISGMSEIAAPLVEIAYTVHEKEQTSEDISPFIYAMF